MELDTTANKKSARPSLVSDSGSAASASKSILSSLESKKAAQNPTHSWVKGVLISMLLIAGAGVITYQMLSVDIKVPKPDIADSTMDSKAEVGNDELPEQDVAVLVNEVTGESQQSNADAMEQLKDASGTPFEGLAIASSETNESEQTADKEKVENKSLANKVTKKTSTKYKKTKRKAKDSDADLIAAIIAHDKTAPIVKPNPAPKPSNPATIAGAAAEDGAVDETANEKSIKETSSTLVSAEAKPESEPKESQSKRLARNSTLTSPHNDLAALPKTVEGLMARCESLDIFEQFTCRNKACDGKWGKSELCPVVDEMAEKVLGKNR